LLAPLTLPQVASQTLRPRRNPLLSPRFAALQKSFLSTEVRTAIDKAVASAPVVLFMKGTPETPQCGFSRAAIQILGLQGVNPQKFTAFNVLEDEELRSGMCDIQKEHITGARANVLLTENRHQRVQRLADDSSAVHWQRVCWWHRYPHGDAPGWLAEQAA
jgi:glutaredoxin-related protein